MECIKGPSEEVLAEEMRIKREKLMQNQEEDRLKNEKKEEIDELKNLIYSNLLNDMFAEHKRLEKEEPGVFHSAKLHQIEEALLKHSEIYYPWPARDSTPQWTNNDLARKEWDEIRNKEKLAECPKCNLFFTTSVDVSLFDSFFCSFFKNI